WTLSGSHFNSIAGPDQAWPIQDGTDKLELPAKGAGRAWADAFDSDNNIATGRNIMSAATLRRPDPNRVYRVAQWATGRTGVSSLRELIRSPQFELVGVYVHSEAKDGKDAGELCGLPATGVKATRDINRIIAQKPDCVVAVQEGCNLDDVCRFLAAGINIATSRVDFLEPERMDPEVRRRTEEACKKGRSSIHATGSSP